MHSIEHKIYNTEAGFWHSLIVNGDEGEPVGYQGIARHGDYRARILDYWGHDVPEVYTEVAIPFTLVQA